MIPRLRRKSLSYIFYNSTTREIVRSGHLVFNEDTSTYNRTDESYVELIEQFNLPFDLAAATDPPSRPSINSVDESINDTHMINESTATRAEDYTNSSMDNLQVTQHGTRTSGRTNR